MIKIKIQPSILEIKKKKRSDYVLSCSKQSVSSIGIEKTQKISSLIKFTSFSSRFDRMNNSENSDVDFNRFN